MAIPLFNVSSSTPSLKDTYNPIANTLSDQERRNKETGDKSVQILRTVQLSKLLKDFREIDKPTDAQFKAFYEDLLKLDPKLAESERQRWFAKKASDAFGGKGLPDDLAGLEAELKQLESDLSLAESGNTTILDNGVKQNEKVADKAVDNVEPNLGVDGNISQVPPVAKDVVANGGDSRAVPVISQDVTEDKMTFNSLPSLQSLLGGDRGMVGGPRMSGNPIDPNSPQVIQENLPLNLPRMYQQEDYINLPRELGGTKKQPLNPLPRRI